MLIFLSNLQYYNLSQQRSNLFFAYCIAEFGQRIFDQLTLLLNFTIRVIFFGETKKIQIWPNCLISYFVRGGSIYLDEPYMGKAATRADGQCVVYCKLVLYSIKSRRHEFCLLIFMECVFIRMLLLKHTRNIHHFFKLKALWSLLMKSLKNK